MREPMTASLVGAAAANVGSGIALVLMLPSPYGVAGWVLIGTGALLAAMAVRSLGKP